MIRKGDWIQTWSGRKFWPFDPRPEDVCIEDIAHSLSNRCRFGGHSKKFYSVAEHSFYVSLYIPFDLALEGLLHDAAETYLSDIPRPIKPFLNGFYNIERKVEYAICERFNLLDLSHPTIKKFDTAILADEAAQLMFPHPDEWFLPERPLGVKLNCFSPEKSCDLFLERFCNIKKV
jgi:uncharacterized protein